MTSNVVFSAGAAAAAAPPPPGHHDRRRGLDLELGLEGLLQLDELAHGHRADGVQDRLDLVGIGIGCHFTLQARGRILRGVEKNLSARGCLRRLLLFQRLDQSADLA